MDPSQLASLKRKINTYKEVLQNTRTYRQVWKDSFKAFIIGELEQMITAVELDAKVDARGEMENLEAVVLSLGDIKSGMYQEVNSDIKRHLIKHQGSLIYQQLFNGKIIVLVNYPYIENYGKPRPPKTIGIYRPEELKEPFIIRHVEDFINEITNWEDYDDDEPSKKIGFEMNFGNPGRQGPTIENAEQDQ